MRKWVPGVALIGLICLMVIPTPGILGIVIGSACALAIIVSVITMLLERFLTRFIEPVWETIRPKRKTKRFIHAGSGMAARSKAPSAKVAAASA